MRLVLIGPPGVGKGTQAGLLKSRLGIRHISSGDVFRAEINAGSELGSLAQKFIDAGELVPDDVTVGMMARHLETKDPHDRGFVLDGFPRTVAQAIALDAKLEPTGQGISRAIAIEVPDEILVERLGGRRMGKTDGKIYHVAFNPPPPGVEVITRSDDMPDVIRERLRVFHENTRPVVDYYRDRGKLRTVDGMADLEVVYAEICAAMYQ